jgi:hypothetical protein
VKRLYTFFVIFLTLCIWVDNTSAQTVVNVPDTTLASKLRTALGLANDAEITDTALAGLTGKLDLTGSGDEIITNLTGLEHATGITELDLRSNYISNLDPLAGLTQLTQLILANNNISDISALASLTNLTELALNNRENKEKNDDNILLITNISPLMNLTALTILALSHNNIVNISVLGNLTSLATLNIQQNAIVDIGVLEKLTYLTSLYISGNRGITDYSPVYWLPRLATYDNQNVNTLPLAVRISEVPDETQNAPFSVKITFNNDVSNFVVGDITLGGSATATVTQLTVNSNLVEDVWEEYTVTITPTRDGDVTIQVPADVAAANGQGNIASAEHTVSVDVPPSVTISGLPTGTQNSAFTVTITFSESVTGFTAADISLTAPATGNVPTTPQNGVFTVTITFSESVTGLQPLHLRR